MVILKEKFDELLKDFRSSEDFLGENGLLKHLTQYITDLGLETELIHHLGYEKYTKSNGKTDNFTTYLVKKREKQKNKFNEKIISLYARGMSVRDIQSHLKEIYGVEVTSDFISKVTDSVVEELQDWQKRGLDSYYPIVYLDCIMVKSRDCGFVQNKAVYLALGINADGHKELLGLWIAQTEGAKFWLSVINELKNRGIQDIFIVCCDGLKGFPEAIETVYPYARVQLCIVHQIRYSLRFVSWKQRKEIADDLRKIYRAATIIEAEKALSHFEAKWDKEHPTISRSWQKNWERLTVFFDYPPAIRKIIYTTNAIESVNSSLRKVAHAKRSFPNDGAVMKALYLSLHCIVSHWTMPIADWKPAMSQFMIMFEDRLEQ